MKYLKFDPTLLHWGHLTKVEPFLMVKPVKPVFHFFLEYHLIQRKKTLLGTVGVNDLVKIDLIPMLSIQNLTKVRKISREIEENELGRGYKRPNPVKEAYPEKYASYEKDQRII